jgi:adenylylsulfate kinase
MARALLIIGPVGSGKTTTLHEIEAMLDQAGTPNAIVDLDWLAWATPAASSTASVHDLMVANLAAVWQTFHTAGIEHIALARMLNDPAEIAAVRAALHGCETTVVELSVDPGVLEQRIRLRDSGVQLAEHLAFLDAYDAEGAEARADAVIDVDDQSPAQVARDVLGVAGW